ncbi:MAG: glycosyl transferase family 2 [Robiginitomaculum sp.]|nr:MAG: glycosyl transferase family 2 [Robiginitomaculum sp.]
MTKTQNWQEGVSCILPTFRRPKGLAIALNSLVIQSDNTRAFEIIVTDNDPEGSAKEYVANFSKTSPVNIVYLHVPNPGVSNARNAALAVAKGRFIAWLDDDQEACPKWVSTLIETSKKHNAALTFCPTIARIPGNSKYNDYYVSFFERQGPALQDGILDNFFGCGNSLMDLENCQLPDPVFDPRTNETGGEDDVLFTHIQRQGGVIAWTRHCHTHEDIRPHRATPKYIKVRSFAFGQGPTEMAAENKNIIGVLKWMCIGFIQCFVYLPLTLVSKLMRHNSYISFIAKFYMGLGKIFWFGRFKPKLYGVAAAKNKEF